MATRVTMEHTDAQRRRIKSIRKDFGSKGITFHAPTPPHGNMRVTLPCHAGLWTWYFDAAGDFVSGYLTTRLFDLPEPEHVPGNALDN